MDKILTVKEAAEFLNCHPQSVYRNKDLPFFLIPGIGKRFKSQDLEKYIDQRTNIPAENITHIIKNNKDSLHLPLYNDTILLDKLGGICEMPKGKIKTRYNLGYGAIYQRKTKKGKIRWYLDYRNSEGLRVQKVAPLATSKEEADIVLRAEISKAFDAEYEIKREKERIKFTIFSELYLKEYAMIAKKSWETDMYRLRILNEFFKNKELREITPLMIQRFRAERLKAGNTKSTTNRYLELMKKIFSVAIEEGYVNENPVKKVKLFSEKDNLQERVLSEFEESKLISECSVHLKSILIIGLNTGMRRGEILNLKWNNVDLSKKVIRVENTKSGKLRFIPINNVLFDELKKLKIQNGHSPFVNFNPDTGKPFRDVMTAFRGACRRAGIKGLRFHDLRHTFASRLVTKGVDIVTVQNLLGHSTISVTQRYTHANDQRKMEAVEMLSGNPSHKAEKTAKLLHGCYMEKGKSREGLPTHLISMN